MLLGTAFWATRTQERPRDEMPEFAPVAAAPGGERKEPPACVMLVLMSPRPSC